jgi:hypothetical protein
MPTKFSAATHIRDSRVAHDVTLCGTPIRSTLRMAEPAEATCLQCKSALALLRRHRAQEMPDLGDIVRTPWGVGEVVTTAGIPANAVIVVDVDEVGRRVVSLSEVRPVG